MQSLLRWSTILGLVGSTVLAPSLVGSMRAMAIPTTEIMKRLERIPVFMITNSQGILISKVPDPKDQKKTVDIATFFVSQEDAQAAINQLKSSKAELGKTAKIAPASLSKVYEVAQENKAKKSSDFMVDLVPEQQEIKSAEALLKQNGKEAPQINDVPLFYAVTVKDNQKFYLSVNQGKSSLTPFYFSKEDIQRDLEAFKKQDPKVKTEIQVASLSSILGFMEKENNDLAKQIVLIPSSEALKYVYSQQQQAAPQK